jgi:hypothetical protein
VTLTGTQTLTNKTLTSPRINEILDTSGNEILGLSPTASATDFLTVKNGIGVGVPLHIYADGPSASIGLHIQPKGSGLVTISDGTDFNKGIRFRSSGSAASAITLLDAVSTAGRVVTLPDATTTLVGRDTTDTLTNKTIAFGSNTFSGSLAIANGGTGQTTANGAFNALAPSQTGNTGKYLTTDGSNTSWAANPLGTVTSVGGTGTVSGISLSGTVTTSGNLTLGGALDLSAYNGAGAFTTLSASSTVTLSGGTTNGVTYLNGSKILTSGSALTFDGTNLETTGRLVVRTVTSPSFAGQIGYSAFGGTYIWPKAGSSDNFNLYDGLGNNAYQINGSYSHVWSVSATEALRLTSSSLYTASGINAGFGTNNPTSKLTIGTGTYSLAASGTTGMYTTGTGLEMLSDSYFFGTRAGGTLMSLSSAGNLAIAGSVSATSGQINGAVGSITAFKVNYSGDISIGVGIGYKTSTGAGYISSQGPYPLELMSNGTVVGSFTSTGFNVTGTIAVGGVQAVALRSFGYGGGYGFIQIGTPNTLLGNVALAVDVSGVAGGSFNGINQVILPAGGTLFVNAAGTNYIGSMGRDGNDSILLGPNSVGGITSGDVVIRTSGNVGIGTNNPLARLDVRSPNQALGSANLRVLTTDAYSVSGAGGKIGLGGIYNSSNSITNFAEIKGNKNNGTDGDFGGYLSFYTQTHLVGMEERIRIQSNGDWLYSTVSANVSWAASGSAGDAMPTIYFPSRVDGTTNTNQSGSGIGQVFADANGAAPASVNFVRTAGTGGGQTSGAAVTFNATRNTYTPYGAYTNAEVARATGLGVISFANNGFDTAGIQFPATQKPSSDANTLDDYEEGTWTPFFRGSGTAGTFTPQGGNEGTYVIVGQMFIAQFSVLGTLTGATGNLQIGGLPITFYAGAYGGNAFVGYFNAIGTAVSSLMAYGDNGQNYVNVTHITVAASNITYMSATSPSTGNPHIIGTIVGRIN